MHRSVAIALPLVLIGALILLTASGPSASDTEATDLKREAGIPQVPAESARVPNPVPATEDSVDYGKLLFSSQCVMCHGKGGAGDGDLVGRLNLQTPDFTDASAMKKRTDGELFYILTHGHGSMPEQGDRWTAENRWNLVNYIRTLAKEAATPVSDR